MPMQFIPIEQAQSFRDGNEANHIILYFDKELQQDVKAIAQYRINVDDTVTITVVSSSINKKGYTVSFDSIKLVDSKRFPFTGFPPDVCWEEINITPH
ncbi:hypothetical protein [Photobacterium leiognathi]|uniref:hypothetical protein n=1 Tax=Photobacterium leiognathi TaxID=553611 RepID=UPI002980F05A|nr:hypothetical protein [Photobacterium leiognathi]